MKDSQSLGDTPPEEFRKQLHELADWIADFREHIEQRRVAPNDKPGTIRDQLPKRGPEESEPFEKILNDVDHIIVPGMVHWSHPMFLGYFGWTSTAPGILGEILSAPLNVNAMTWRTCPAATELETVVIDWLRQWVGLSDEFEGVIYDTACGRTRRSRASDEKTWAHRSRFAALSHLHFRSGAQRGRKSVHRPRARRRKRRPRA
jgi:aromatic-L-amino-acid decarboxylase